MVEPAQATDLQNVIRLASDALGMDPGSIPSRMADGWCLVARDIDQGHVVGFALAERHAPCEGHLMALAVDGTRQGEGIGSTLLRRMQDELARSGAMRFCLEARADDEKARGFYQRHGFQPEGLAAGSYADGGDAVHYSRPI